MKIGIFGGTFNPIHYGHLRSAEEVRLIFGLDRIFFVPSGNPPLKRKDLTDAGHRYNMVSIAARDNPYFEVLDIESIRPGKSYTVNTLEQLLKDYADADFSFISGVDAFLDIPNWHEPGKDTFPCRLYRDFETREELCRSVSFAISGFEKNESGKS